MTKLTAEEREIVIDAVRFHCQVDKFKVEESNEGLLMKFHVIDSDPEHYFDLLNIKQEGSTNIVNLDYIKQGVIDDEHDMRDCFLPLWETIQDSQNAQTA